jgi:hypothetical protein
VRLSREDLADLKSQGSNVYALAIAAAERGEMSHEQMAEVLRSLQKAHVEAYDALDAALMTFEAVERTADAMQAMFRPAAA